MSQHRIDKYVEEGGNYCPICGSEDISGGSFSTDSGIASQSVGCQRCDAVWFDEYKLVSITITDRGFTCDSK